MKQPVSWTVIRVLTLAHVVWPGFIMKLEGVKRYVLGTVDI